MVQGLTNRKIDFLTLFFFIVQEHVIAHIFFVDWTIHNRQRDFNPQSGGHVVTPSSSLEHVLCNLGHLETIKVKLLRSNTHKCHSCLSPTYIIYYLLSENVSNSMILISNSCTRSLDNENTGRSLHGKSKCKNFTKTSVITICHR